MGLQRREFHLGPCATADTRLPVARAAIAATAVAPVYLQSQTGKPAVLARNVLLATALAGAAAPPLAVLSAKIAIPVLVQRMPTEAMLAVLEYNAQTLLPDGVVRRAPPTPDRSAVIAPAATATLARPAAVDPL